MELVKAAVAFPDGVSVVMLSFTEIKPLFSITAKRLSKLPESLRTWMKAPDPNVLLGAECKRDSIFSVTEFKRFIKAIM